MLNRLPRDPGSFAQALRDIGCGDWPAQRVGEALGVSARTVQRWRQTGTNPRIATLAVWWLTAEGHAVWDAEMATRTRLALDASRALWAEVGRLRTIAADADRARSRALDDADAGGGMRPADHAAGLGGRRRSQA